MDSGETNPHPGFLSCVSIDPSRVPIVESSTVFYIKAQKKSCAQHLRNPKFYKHFFLKKTLEMLIASPFLLSSL